MKQGIRQGNYLSAFCLFLKEGKKKAKSFGIGTFQGKRLKGKEVHRMSNLSRRGFLAASTTAVAGLALSGCSSSSSSSSASTSQSAETKQVETITVNVGYWGGTCEAPLYVAAEKGFFKEQSIDVNITKITAGSTAWLADCGSDQGAYCVFEATPNFLPAIAQGMDIKYVSEVHTGCIQACATAASGITDVAGLAGQKIGTFDTHDMGEIFLRAAMMNAGADPESCEYITEGNIGTMLTEAAAGNIVAFANFDPYVEIAVEYFGYTRIFNNATDKNFKDQTCCFLAGNKAVYSNTEVSARIAAAVNAACKWIEENPADAATLIQGQNDSGTAYVTPTSTLLEAFGVDPSKATDDLHQKLLETYTWGNISSAHFTSSLTEQWNTVDKVGMNSTGKSVDELVKLCGAYCGL